MIRTIARKVLSFVGHSLPVASGLGMFAEQGICRWSVDGLGDRALARLRSGMKLAVDPSEYLGRTVLLTGEWDPKVSWVCKRLLRKGDAFLDVGAHCGIVSVEAARLVGSQGAVHAFEPQPKMAQLLRESAKINGHSWLTVHELALSDSDGRAEIHLPGGKQILASLIAPDVGGTSISIETKDSARFLDALGLNSIRLMKIDVEGYEHVVFSSLAPLLRSAAIEFILFESVPAEGPFFERPAIRKLQEFGYQFLALPKRLFKPVAIAVDQESQMDSTAHDFVATRDMRGTAKLLG